MAYYQSTYHSKIYRDFKEIDRQNYRKIVHFFEEREESILRLDEDERFELLTAYVESLFEIGSYQKHLLMVDHVIEASINQNIRYYRQEDIFQKMLFRKAASFYNVLEYERAEYILRELLRMDRKNKDAAIFLKKCLRKKEPALIQHTRATAIFLFLLGALVICIEVLVVRPFFEMHTQLIEMSRIAIIGLGCMAWAGGLLWHRWWADREVERFLHNS